MSAAWFSEAGSRLRRFASGCSPWRRRTRKGSTRAGIVDLDVKPHQVACFRVHEYGSVVGHGFEGRARVAKEVIALGNGNPEGVSQQAPPVEGLRRGRGTPRHPRRTSCGAMKQEPGLAWPAMLSFSWRSSNRSAPAQEYTSRARAHPDIEAEPARAVEGHPVAGDLPLDVQSGARNGRPGACGDRELPVDGLDAGVVRNPRGLV